MRFVENRLSISLALLREGRSEDRAAKATRELMHRMGHGSMRAALIYQHATTDRDRSIADALSELADLGRTEDSTADNKEDDGDDGADGALVPVA